MAEFDKDGNLWMKKGIKLGCEMNPEVSTREWFYLLFEDCAYSDIKNWKFIKNILGSSVTRWRTKNSLIKKGYL